MHSSLRVLKMGWIPGYELPFDRQGRPSPQARFMVERKFNTALRLSTVQCIRDELIAIKCGNIKSSQMTLDAKLLLVRGVTADSDLIVDSTFLPRLLLEVLTNGARKKHSEKNKEHHEAMLIMMKAQIHWYTQMLINVDDRKEMSSDVIEKLKQNWPKEILDFMAVTREFEEVVEKVLLVHNHEFLNQGWTDDQIEKKRQVSHHTFKSIDGLTLEWGHKYVLWHFQEQSWILPRVCIQEAYCKFADSLSAMLYAFFSQDVSYPNHTFSNVAEYIQLASRCHINDPEHFFTFASNFEGICLGLHLMKTEEEWKNVHLYNNIISDLQKDIGAMFYVYDGLIYFLNEQSPLTLSVLTCMSKITGHPLINVESSAERVLERATKDISFEWAAVKDIIADTKRQYILSYIDKKGRWPDVDLVSPLGQRMKAAKLANMSPELDVFAKFGPLELDHWGNVELLKNEEFEEFSSLIPWLADKSVCLTLPAVKEAFFEGGPLPKNNKVDTRLLLTFLTSIDPTGDFHKYEKLYLKACESDNFELIADYLVMKLVPKELENKDLKARLFGIRHILERLRGQVEESNAMRFLREYNPSQALQITELQLAKKIHALTSLRYVFPDHTVYMVSFDASGWCGRFRHNVIHSFMKETLDKIFGVKRFQYVQRIYEKTTYFVPDYPHGYGWEGQLGGIEGLNQSVWTQMYSSEINHALKPIPGEHKSLIKGDDTRVFLIIPNSAILTSGMSKKEYADHLMKTVADGAAKFGHELKIPESYPSTMTFAFSKIIHFLNFMLPADFRKILKGIGLSDALFPFADDQIASCFATCHAASFYSISPIICYAMAAFWSLWVLLGNKHYSKLTPKQLAAVLMTPSVVGGPPILYLHHMMVRAESDHFTAFLDFLSFLENYDSELYRMISQFITWGFSSKPNYKQLLSDPYSLPWIKPPTAKAAIKTYMKQQLPHLTRNKEILDLFSHGPESQLDELVETLLTSDVWNGKVFHLYYTLTIDHLVEEMLVRFMTAGSVVQYGLKFAKRSINRKISSFYRIDHQSHESRISRLKSNNPLPDWFKPGQCPFNMANKGREIAWLRKFQAITQPDCLHQIKVGTPKDFVSVAGHALNNHFTINVRDVTMKPVLGMESPLFASAKYDPHHRHFLGHRTSPGTLTPAVSLTFSNRITQIVADGLMLASWTNRVDSKGDTSNSPALIDTILSPYAPDALRRFQPFERSKKSGQDQHRLSAAGFVSTIMPNCLINNVALFSVESNTHSKLASTTKNFRINFFELQCQAMLLLSQRILFTKTKQLEKTYWIQTTPCECSSESFEEDMILFKRIAVSNRNLSSRFLSLSAQATRIMTEKLEEFRLKKDYNQTCDINDLSEPEITAGEVMIRYVFMDSIRSSRNTETSNAGISNLTNPQKQLLHSVESSNEVQLISQTAWRAVPPEIICRTIFPFIFSWIIKTCTSTDTHGLIIKFMMYRHDNLPWVAFCVLLRSFGMSLDLLKFCSECYNHPIPGYAIDNEYGLARYLGLCAIRHMDGADEDDYLTIHYTNHESPEAKYEKYRLSWMAYRWLRAKRCYIDPINLTSDHIDLNFLLEEGENPMVLITKLINELSNQAMNMMDFQEALTANQGNSTFMIDAYESYSGVQNVDDLGTLILSLENPYSSGNLVWSDWEHKCTRKVVQRLIGHNLVNYQKFLENPANEAEVMEVFMNSSAIVTDDHPQFKIVMLDLSTAIDLLKTCDKNNYARPKDSLPPAPFTRMPLIAHRPTRFGFFEQVHARSITDRRIACDPLEIPELPRGSFTSSLLRPFGTSTTAVCKFIAAFSDLGLLDQFKCRDLQLFGMFVGDGRAGTLLGFLSLNPYNKAFFNTLNSDPRLPNNPVDVLMNPDLRDRVSFELQHQGVTDLSDPVTIEYIAECAFPYPHVIHCDADCDDPNIAPRIHTNIVGLFRRLGGYDTIMMIKIKKSNWHHLISLCQLVHESAKTWSLYMPYCDYGGESIYIVAQGVIPSIQLPLRLPTHCSDNVDATVKSFMKRLLQHHRLPLGAKFEIISPSIVDFYNLGNSLKLPSFVEESIGQVFALPRSLDYRGWMQKLAGFVLEALIRIKGWLVKRTTATGTEEYNFQKTIKQAALYVMCDSLFLTVRTGLWTFDQMVERFHMAFGEYCTAVGGITVSPLRVLRETGRLHCYQAATGHLATKHRKITATLTPIRAITRWCEHLYRDEARRQIVRFNVAFLQPGANEEEVMHQRIEYDEDD